MKIKQNKYVFIFLVLILVMLFIPKAVLADCSSCCAPGEECIQDCWYGQCPTNPCQCIAGTSGSSGSTKPKPPYPPYIPESIDKNYEYLTWVSDYSKSNVLGAGVPVECVACGNYTCYDPCTPAASCACDTSCLGGSSSSSTNPLTGPLCEFSQSHGPCDLGCGESQSCSSTTCYWPETNLADPTAPTSIDLTVGSIHSLLSTDSNLRSLVPSPLTSESVFMAVPAYTYSGAYEILYAHRANNQDNGSDWIDFIMDLVNARDEDINTISPLNNLPYNPVLGSQAVLQPNYYGHLWVHNLTRNKCNTTYKWSPARAGFYRVNTLPTSTSVSKTFGESTVASGQSQGCISNSYTGWEANNPVGFTVTYNDINNTVYSDVEALYVWFSNTTTSAGNPPTISSVSTSGTRNPSNNDLFGFMIRKENTTWNSVPSISNEIGNVGGNWSNNLYVSSESGGSWSLIQVTDGMIVGDGGDPMVRIYDTAVSVNGNNLTLQFKAEFFTDDDSNREQVTDGTYKIMGSASDHFSFLPVGGSTLRRQPIWNLTGMNWSIDLTKPTTTIGDPYVSSAQKLAFISGVDDEGGSGVKRVVGDSYRTGGDDIVVNGPIDKFSPLPKVTGYRNNLEVPLAPEPLVLALQNYNSGNYLWMTESSSDQEVVVDIRDNEGGGFLFYSTAFDNACNASNPDPSSRNLFGDIGSPWLITKGGSFYSSDNVSIPVKEFGPLPSPDVYEFFTVREGLFTFKRSETQLSTEFLSNGTDFLNKYIIRTPENVNSYRLLNYLEGNDVSGYWFDRLYEDFDRMNKKYGITRYSIVPTSTFVSFIETQAERNISENGSGASIVFLGNEDIIVGKDLICDKKTLIMVDADIYVNPDVTRKDNGTSADLLNGCLFIASGDIILGEGGRASNAPPYPKYDLLEGLFLADNRIIILEADISETLPARDGLKIHGSIYGMGSVDSPGIVLSRSLKLQDNTQFPVEAVHYDPRYLELIKYFFGGINYTYKRETGWKPI